MKTLQGSMKTPKPVFFIFTLLFMSTNASVYALQQDNDMLAKTSVTDNLSPNNPVNAISKTTVTKPETDTSYNHIDTRYRVAVDRLKQQAASIQSYAKVNNYSSDYVFLVDMSIPSGKNRFFVYNLKADSLECSSLVAHGFGSTVKDSEDQLIFSNNNYSCKTSLGKYKIGSSYNGTYGLAYKLYGLDSTNSRAFERAIV
ncbi:MAG: murein L,D-transpeptidase catalytic domain-containing protein, partial [Ferruginibacter sp.]